MSLAIGCFTELYVTASTPVLRIALALNRNIPAHCRPIGGNVLLQILCVALYSALLDVSTKDKSDRQDTSNSADTSCELSPFNPYDRSTAATALAEAICSIDEDNKHTAQIDSFLLLVRERYGPRDVARFRTSQFTFSPNNANISSNISRTEKTVPVNRCCRGFTQAGVLFTTVLENKIYPD